MNGANNNLNGLSSIEAENRLDKYGKNTIKRQKKRSFLLDFLDQLIHPLALLLWAAASLALLGNIEVLSIAIVLVIFLNAVFAFVQEREAESATEALKKYLPSFSLVRRGGEVSRHSSEEIVPGDALLVFEGDRIPADGEVMKGSLELDTSPLTGEADPVIKEYQDMVFSGELCTGGEAEVLVTKTGMQTRLGRIAMLSEKIPGQKSPLQIQINSVAKFIAIIAILMGFVFAAIGVFAAELPARESITFAIGILVANVPEGLLPTITLALAVAVRKMAKKEALLKRLTAVETLGSTDVICTDKTGTLTEGKMKVDSFWAGEDSNRLSELLLVACCCNNSRIKKENSYWKREGDPSESALLIGARDLNYTPPSFKRLKCFRFDPHLKRMTTLDSVDGDIWAHTKGAPQEILNISNKFPKKIDKQINKQSRKK